MREIKFRAKRTDNGAWVYGDLTHVQRINTKEQAEQSGRRSEPAVRIANYDVDEQTIGQYTGMHDADGKEIYEGDVILQTIVFGERKYSEEYIRGAFCLCRNGDIFLALVDVRLSIYVKGNIHDNPELLTK